MVSFTVPVAQSRNTECFHSSQVKIHYTLEGDTSVLATISANVSTIDFIMKGLPGQPES